MRLVGSASNGSAILLAVVLLSVGVFACSDEATESAAVEPAPAARAGDVYTLALDDACGTGSCPGTIFVRIARNTEMSAEKLVESLAGYEPAPPDDVLFDDEETIADGSLVQLGPVIIEGDVARIDVSTQTSLFDFRRETYVYERADDGWRRVSPESVGITATTAVS